LLEYLIISLTFSPDCPELGFYNHRIGAKRGENVIFQESGVVLYRFYTQLLLSNVVSSLNLKV